MRCPSEDAFAKFQAGLLSDHQAAAIHRHLDQCDRCLELAGVLGRMDADAKVQRSWLAAELRWRLAITMAIVVLVHLYTIASMAPAYPTVFAASAGLLRNTDPWAVFALIHVKYVALWGVVGFLSSSLAAVGIARAYPWSRQLAGVVALFSIPTGFLAPLGLCLIHTLAQGGEDG